MSAGSRGIHRPSARPQRYPGRWFALPAAILANALLFYALAAARIEPSMGRVQQPQAVYVRVVDLPAPDVTEQDLLRPAPDRVRVLAPQTPAVAVQPVPEIPVALTPRLPNGIREGLLDLPGLPVALPGQSDLRTIPGVSVSGIEGPLPLSRVDRAPEKITGAPPRYPAWARRARMEAVVTLRFVVTEAGEVTNINIHHIDGDKRFGREAMRAIAEWRFRPALRRGRPVACWCFQKVSFTLDY